MTTLATQIRDKAVDLLSASVVGGKFLTIQKTPPPMLQAGGVPALGVFITSEDHSPDGDANVVQVRFVSEVTIALMALVEANVPDTSRSVLDEWMDQIEETLLTDPAFLGMLDKDSSQPIIEGVNKMIRVNDWPANGQRYFSRATTRITFGFRCFFEMQKPNALNEVLVTASQFQGPTGIPPAPSLEVDLPSPP